MCAFDLTIVDTHGVILCRHGLGSSCDVLRLAVMQELSRFVRLSGCGKDRSLVVLEYRQPIADVVGMILAGLCGDMQVGAEVGCC